MTLDEIRAAYPHLGIALYAYEPGGPVTLEVFSQGEIAASFEGHTVGDVIAAAFPVHDDDSQSDEQSDNDDTEEDVFA